MSFLYKYSHECTLDILASPYGLAAVKVFPLHTAIMGVGSVYLDATLHIPNGKVYFNDSTDFEVSDRHRYRVLVYMETERGLRIDFFKYTVEELDSTLGLDIVNSDPVDVSTLLSQYLNELRDKEDWCPTIIFRGEVDRAYPTSWKKSIGIMAFEHGPQTPTHETGVSEASPSQPSNKRL